MTSRPDNLPDYELPPVIEVAFSVQYQQDIAGFSMAQAGRFWVDLGPEFSRVTEAPPIQPAVERAEGTVKGFQIEISNLPPSRRIQLVHHDEGWVIQLQPDRFLLNWRADHPDAVYPRFDSCFKRFREYRKQFEQFCANSGLNLPPPNQYELTYVNHVPRGEGWNSTADVGAIFPDIGWRTDREFLPSPKTITWSTVFEMPEGTGRLHASVKTARKKPDNTEVLLLDLTARGFPNNSEVGSEQDWFNLAREWIVKGFADLTDRTIQTDRWGRKA